MRGFYYTIEVALGVSLFVFNLGVVGRSSVSQCR